MWRPVHLGMYTMMLSAELSAVCFSNAKAIFTQN